MAEKHVYRFGAGIDGVNATEPAGQEPVDQAKWVARRQGRQPRRDGQHRPARASGIHHHLPDLHGVRQRRQRLAGRRRSTPSHEYRRRPGGAHGQEARRRRGPAARVRPLRRPILHARHDGHGAEPRPQRRVHQRPHQADREPALRLGLLPPLHPDVLQRRHGARRRSVRERHHRP